MSEAAHTAQERIDRRSVRWVKHREERYETLIAQAMEVIRQNGATVSMDQMAEELGTSKSIIYRYFGDKFGLRRAVAMRCVEEWKATLEEDYRNGVSLAELVRRSLLSYFTMLADDPEVYIFMTSAPVEHGAVAALVGESNEPLLLTISAAVPEVLAGDGVLGDARSRVWAVGMVSFVRGVGEKWLRARQEAARGDGALSAEADRALVELSAEEMADLVASMIASALG